MGVARDEITLAATIVLPLPVTPFKTVTSPPEESEAIISPIAFC